MSDLIAALRDKVSVLEDEREELEDSLNRTLIKIQIYEELLAEEEGKSVSAAPKRKPGRPRAVSKNGKLSKNETLSKTSTHAVEDTLWREAITTLPGGASRSTLEDQARAKARFNPVPRQQPNYGVKVGCPEDVLGNSGQKDSNVRISVEEEKSRG